jgi:hypothetical protein
MVYNMVQMCLRAMVAETERHSPDNVFSDIILLGQVEEFPDFGGTLRTQSVGEGSVGEAGNVVVTGLGDGNGEDTDIVTDDATTDGLKSASSLG